MLEGQVHFPRRRGVRSVGKEFVQLLRCLRFRNSQLMVELHRCGDVCAIVVTFNPDLPRLERLLVATLPQVGAIIAVDNASSASTQAWLRARCKSPGMTLIDERENRGLAAAHNIGFKWARRNGYRYALLLDQDSVPALHMVSRLRTALHRVARAHRRVAAVGPRCVDRDGSRTVSFVQLRYLRNRHMECRETASSTTVPVDFLITSGSLIPLSAFDEVGTFDERLFIDNVDLEWCFRARSRGLGLYGTCGAVLEHRLGTRAGRFVWHPPPRLYYMMRNRLLLYRRRHIPYQWIGTDACRLIGKFCLFAAVVSPRVANMRMMLLGLWHGLRGKDGALR